MPLSQDKLDIATEAYQSSAVFGKTFFPDTFSRPFDKIHYNLFEFIDNREYVARQQNSNPQLLACAVPRGIGKSTILNTLLSAKSIVFQEAHFVLQTSATASQAQQESENLKYQLTAPGSLHQFFDIQQGPIWNKEKWVVDVDGHECCVYPRGSGQGLRGARYRHWRPDRVIVDDLEDPEEVLTEEQRAKQKEWFFGSLYNVIDRGRDDWLFIVLGTILHPNALLVHLLNDPNWTTYELPIANDDLTVSNAPNFMPVEKIHQVRKEMDGQGKLDSFWREYMNSPSPRGSDATYTSDMFKEYDPELDDRLNDNPDVENFLLLDVARSVKKTSAESAIVGIGLDIVKNIIYVRYIAHGHWLPDRFYDEIFLACHRLNTNLLGVEVTGLNEFITQPLTNEGVRRGWPLDIIDLHARGGNANETAKERRSKPLLYFYRSGLVRHNPEFCSGLEGDLLGWPRPRRWDIIDAFAYLPQMLEKGERYMLPIQESDDPFLEEESALAVEREYADLGYGSTYEDLDYDPVPDPFDFRRGGDPTKSGNFFTRFDLGGR